MIFIILVVLFVAFLIWSLFRTSAGDRNSRYSKTRNWVDFDAGIDSDKVGSKEYPTAGVDAVMKHEFLDSLDKRQEK